MLLYADQKSRSQPASGRVCFDPQVRGNWIRKAILRRLERDGAEERDDVVRKIKYKEKVFESSGAFVDVTCREVRQDCVCLHRFYVVDHADFDVLIGRPAKEQSRRSAGDC